MSPTSQSNGWNQPRAACRQDPPYRGAHFCKCDLHLHTPADSAHWLGPETEATQEAADAYIRRCYEAGLQAIAITDHNFASKGFIPLLRAAIGRLAGGYGYSIVLFPGFELKADVGKGLHVLAIFEPGFDLDSIDHILTECGAPFPRSAGGQPAGSTKRLPEILDIVQRKGPGGALQGLLILPHSQSDSGIFDTDRIADWLQAEEFTNPDLYAVEVPKPIGGMSPGWHRLFKGGPDCDQRWRRRRPIACIMSSDAKSLRPGEGARNYIGFRHTWIKMSRPSIEALRQAFLDQESRIRLVAEPPEESYAYPKICSFSVKGAAFLQDTQLAFSPNLTTVIGGRGTGKSTLVEYLRIASGQEDALRAEEPRKNFQRLKQTIRGDTAMSATLAKEGQQFSIESVGGKPPVVASGQAIPDLARFFPVRMLSQKELYTIAEDREARRRLVDDLVRQKLDQLAGREQDLIREVRNLSQQIAALPELQEREKVLRTQRQDLELRLASLKSVEEQLAGWKGRLAEERFFQRLDEETAVIAGLLREAVEKAEYSVTTLGSELLQAPSQELIRAVAQQADGLAAKLRQDVEQAIAEFESQTAALLAGEPIAAWRRSMESERSSFEVLRKELAEQGADPDQYLTYQRRLRETDVELAEILNRIAGIETLKARREALLRTLHENWQEAAEARRGAATRLTGAVRTTATGQPFVRVTVEPFGDEKAFLERLRQEVRDRRRISEDDWDDFMRAVLPASASFSPTSTLSAWMSQIRRHERPDGCPWDLGDRRMAALLQWLTQERLAELELWRTPDNVRIELFRQDGSLVGDLEGGQLSVGQRCTAVLALVLAEGEAPVIIDQPEEDLDNEFIFSELVPLLRKVKERRQVIVVSHNANIPVNGDAELVVALDIRQERGCVRAAGGLDRADVKRAVEDIMEGSEEAFRRRFEKYGF